MHEQRFIEITTRIEKVNKVISTLEPEIRSAAFEVLREYVTAGAVAMTKDKGVPHPTDEQVETMAVLERLIHERPTATPTENVYLLAAEWYSEYGCHPFTVNALKKRSNAAGLIIPARTDNTVKRAVENGKRLFQAEGDGFKPTVPGEIYFRANFKVQKGTKTPPANEGS